MTRSHIFWARAVLAFALCALASSSLAAREAGEPQRFHTVYAGQRLASIAKRYKVTVEALRNANGLGKSERLKAGQKLVVPGLDDPDGSRARELYPPQHPTDAPVKNAALNCSTSAGKEREDCSESRPTLRTHKVSPGQRLESIAKRYRVSVEALCAANGFARRVKLRPGQVLTIPNPGATPEQAEAEANEARHATPLHKRGYVELFTYSAHYRGVVLDKKGN
ncbi:MAG TPA: LysM peptidoglycan-binding domain-containing protein, partial [Polyangiaceae bacterium]